MLLSVFWSVAAFSLFEVGVPELVLDKIHRATIRPKFAAKEVEEREYVGCVFMYPSSL